MSKATGRFGVPSLVAFLILGMIAGSEGIGGIYFDNAAHAQTLGIVALVYILFSGGLDTDLKMVRPILKEGILLSTLGSFLTCLLIGAFVVTAFHFSWPEGLLLGAIVCSTDAAAVFTVLRTKGVNLKGNIRPLLELESGSNDPMAVLLTVGILQFITTQSSLSTELIPKFFLQMLIGGAGGYLTGKAGIFLINHIKLEFDGLYPVVTLALILLSFGLTQALGGNGFLAVYIAGLVLGSVDFIHKKSLVLFHDGIAWLMQIAMFLSLGLLVFPGKLVPVAGQGLVISLFLILLARPIAVFISLIGSKFSLRERAMTAWVGLRGSVPIILATYPSVGGVERADHIFHLVFFIVITSVLIQGTTIPLVAKWLRVESPLQEKFRFPLEYTPRGNMTSDLVELEVPKNSQAVGKTILELQLPKDTLIVLIQRQGNVIIPKGSTHFEAFDTLLLLAEKETLDGIRKLLAPIAA